MTLFKHTEPPKETGYYWTNKGEYHFKDGKWRRCGTEEEVFPDYWYLPYPPKEIERCFDVLEDLLNDGTQTITINRDTAETLLNLRAE